MDTSANDKTPNKYKVDGIPAFFYFKDGKVVSNSVGYSSKEDLVKSLGLPAAK